MFGIELVIPAFIAGIIMFLAPCTLPLVPAYLGVISGVSTSELRDRESFKKRRWGVFKNGVFFVLGFSLIFILFGTAVGFLGSFLGAFQFWLRVVGGIFILIFGLYLLGILKLDALAKEYHFSSAGVMRKGGSWGSFLTGSVFASGWSPCVGPVLGSILLVASTEGSALAGAGLLAVFSAGMAIPFLLVALFVSRFFVLLERSQKAIMAMNIVSGVFLILIGILILTNNFQLLITWGYRAFEFINYDALLDYL